MSERSPEELLAASVNVSVTLSSQDLSLDSLLACTPGSVILLGGVNPRDLELRVGGTLVGRGAVVQVGDRLALRLDAVRPAREVLGDILAQDPD